MKPFDLVLAKAGDSVVWVYPGDAPKPVHFIGIDMHGWAVVQTPERQPACFDRVKTMDLRMAPKKVKRWVNFCVGGVAYHYDSSSDAELDVSMLNCKVLSIAVPIEYEV